METVTLKLARSLGTASREDYIDWAVERLCEGMDSPSLRVLAGLNPNLESFHVEPYFRKVADELGLEFPGLDQTDPRPHVELVVESYQAGDLSAAEAIRHLVLLHRDLHFAYPWLWPFVEIQEELSLATTGHEGLFYSPEWIEDLDRLFEVEVELFRRTAVLKPPAGFFQFIHCLRCGQFGRPQWRPRTLLARARARFLGSNEPRHAACSVCGSFDHRSLMDPDVRRSYFDHLARISHAVRSETS